MQSISKIVSLMLAILDNGEDYIFHKVGMEPTGDPFNSILKLETSSAKRPNNPMINAGAIAISSFIHGKDERGKFERLLDFMRLIMEDPSLDVNYKIYVGESETGNRNRSMGYFLKSEGTIEGNVEEALDVYFKQCSVEVDTKNLATLGLFLANNGVLSNGKKIVSTRVAKIIKTLMVTCGMLRCFRCFCHQSRFAFQEWRRRRYCFPWCRDGWASVSMDLRWTIRATLWQAVLSWKISVVN